MENPQTNSNVMANKMRVEFPFYHTPSQMESNADLFQFHGQELGRLSVEIHQADTCSLRAQFYKILLRVEDRRVKISLGRRKCTRHGVRSCLSGGKSEFVHTMDKRACALISEA